MNSISGLSVLKKPFSWKFTKYHRFQKKIKLQIKQKEDEVSVKDALNMSWEDEPESYTVLEVGTPPDSGIHEPCPQFCWDFDRKRKKQKRPPNAKRADDSEVDSDLGSETEEDGLYSTVAENVRRSSQYWSLPGALGTVPLYENASKKKATKHFYENYRLSSSLSSSDEDETATGSSGENEELEHIYDYVENVHEGGSPLGKSYPVNVFLSLIEGADNTISPDPNIYEVPPGAILNLAGSPPDNHSMHNITPPNGFKDTLTWGRRHELSSLPVDALYSSVVKPKRKKVKKRPGLDVLKNLTAQEDVEAHTATPPGEEVKEKPGTTNEVQEIEALEVKSNSKNESLKLDPKNEEDAKVTPEEASEDALAKSSVTSSNEPVKKEEGTRVVEVRTESEVEKATKELRNAVGKIGRSRRQNDAVEPAAEVEKVTAEVTVAEDKAAKSGCRADKKTKERPARKPKPAIKPESTDKESPMSPEALAKAEIGKAVDSKQSFKEENAELSSETRGGKNEASVTDESKIKKSEPHKEAVIKSKEITAENHESSEKRSKSPQNKIKSDTNERAKKSDGSQGTLRRKKGKAKHAPNVKSPEETASSPSGDSCPPESNLKPTSVNKKKQNKNSRPDPKEKMKGSKAPAKSDRPKAEDCDAASRPPIIPILKKVVNEKQTQNQERYLKRQISHSPLEAIDQSDEKSKTNKLITPPEVPANKTENNDQVGKTPQNSTCEPKEKFNTEIKFCEKDETSKTSELDDTSRLVSEKETDQTKLTSFSENLQQNTPIAIEISDDGTWGSADPNSTSEKAETESSEKCEELKSSDFLNANLSAEDIKMQHVLSEYGNSYFIQTANKPVEKKSSKPAGANNHVGNKGKVQSSAPAQRCSLRDELKRFVRESEMAAQRALEAEKELPKEQQPERIVESEVTPQEIHKLESGTETEDAEILAKGRKGVLEKTMVRAKKRDSWIKGEDVTLSTDKERRIDDWLSTGAQQLSLPAKLPEEIYDLAMDPNISLLITKEGEIVYDSIIQNKHKTKTYWEQLMMAAEMGTQPPAPPLLKQFNGDCQDDKAHSEISEDFYDAESHNSLNSPELHSLEAGLVGPKIVEKVAKKLLEAVESRPTKRATEESVIEREIKLQRERELALVREREAAAAKAQARAPEMKTLGGSLSPEVTTVLKEADDEWRRRSCKDEDLFNSIPTTDEGNCSEYGSEGKDDFSPETNNSRVMSPEVEMGGQIHQRTQSMDSMSSGHSSGSSSGLSSHLDCSYVSVNARRRGITVKPLDEPEEENSTFFRNERETPIEREIRLAREREEELRREKNNNMNNIIKSNENPPTHQQNKTMNSTNFSSRNSINVEQELLIIKAEENIDVQSKVNQLNSLSQRSKSNDKKPAPLQLKKHLSKSVVNLSCAKELESELTVPSPTSPATPNSHFKKFVGAPATQKRGLMKRFLESRGKLGSTFTLNAPALNSEPIKKLSTFSSPNSNQNCVSVVNAPPRKHYVKKIQNKEENSSIGTRPGYKSAEEKIQNELMEMRRREEELRRQRAFSLARSQPNLLSLIDGEGEIVDNEKEKDIEILDRLPPMSKLRTALSNPNLLDVDEKPVQKKIQQRKKSALITEWENRIQKNIE